MESANNISDSTGLSKPLVILSWVLQIAVAAILIQTLFFKFTGHPDSIYIFETVGMEPFGRIGSGIAELIASVLVLTPATIWIGSSLAAGVISGAIFFHLFGGLGIEVNGDGGVLFALAVVVFIASLMILFLRRKTIPIIGEKL
ncbi:MAG: DoxX family protein [Verrucomicrobiota bacterium]